MLLSSRQRNWCRIIRQRWLICWGAGVTLAQPSILNGGGSAWGRDGLTLSLTDEAQSDWITGPENAFNVGAAIIMRGETTVLDPVLLYSNDTRRVDGFFLNVSRQIAL